MHNLVGGKSVGHRMHEGCIYEDFPWEHYLGGAGLVSTLQDYCNFAKMMLNRGRFEKRQLLREDTFNMLCTPQVSSNIMPGAERWGLVFELLQTKHTRSCQ
jgi:CubicO group peptidase (beta-lactamase class C family)